MGTAFDNKNAEHRQARFLPAPKPGSGLVPPDTNARNRDTWGNSQFTDRATNVKLSL